jgi:hypothetical protein
MSLTFTLCEGEEIFWIGIGASTSTEMSKR